MILIKPLLYYQQADLEVHQVSENIEKLYELKPKSSHNYGNRQVTINSLGFRDRERKKEKGKNVFRIVCFGGSNTYGAAVNDNEIYTYYFEELLNKRTQRKYEVWNAGSCAYSLTQNVETAKLVLREYAPDLLIFQWTNDTRRAFLNKNEYAHFLRKNPSLYWENLRFIPAVNSSLGRWIFVNSCGYRSLIVLINRIKTIPVNNKLFMNERAPHIEGYCENEMRFAKFYAETSPRIPVLAWTLNNNSAIHCGGVNMDTINVFNPVYYLPHMSKEYFAMHPPAFVYKWYAEVLFKELRRKQLI